MQFFLRTVGSLSLTTKLSNWQSVNRTNQKGFCTFLPLAHSVLTSVSLCKVKCVPFTLAQLSLQFLDPCCGSLPLHPAASATLPLKTGSFSSHSSPSSRKTMWQLLLRGLQHEFKQRRQLWSHLATPFISPDLNSPFQTCRRKAPGSTCSLGGVGWLKPSHCSCVELWKRRYRERGHRSKTGMYKILQ